VVIPGTPAATSVSPKSGLVKSRFTTRRVPSLSGMPGRLAKDMSAR